MAMDELSKICNEIARLRERLAALDIKAKPLKEALTEKQNRAKQLMSKSGIRSHKTTKGLVYLSSSTRAVIDDYPRFIGYVKRQGAWDLLPRSCNSKAVKERLDDGKKVSGISLMESDTLNFKKG